MTDEVMDFTGTPEKPSRRGRPRSQETVERDERVLTVLRENGPTTKEQLVEALGMTPEKVYLSLWRLRKESKVERTSSSGTRHVWQVVA